LEFSIKAVAPERLASHASDCVVVGVFEKRKLAPAAEALDRATRGKLRDVLKRGDMDGRAGTTRLLSEVPHVAAERVLLVGLGRENEFGAGQYRNAVKGAMNVLVDTGARDVHLCFPELHVAGKRHAVFLLVDRQSFLVIVIDHQRVGTLHGNNKGQNTAHNGTGGQGDQKPGPSLSIPGLCVATNRCFGHCHYLDITGPRKRATSRR